MFLMKFVKDAFKRLFLPSAFTVFLLATFPIPNILPVHDKKCPRYPLGGGMQQALEYAALCDALAAGIVQAEEVRGRLLGAVLNGAGEDHG
jgi:hypothetical protein